MQYTTSNTGGSKDAIIVSHTHTQKSHSHNAKSGYYFLTVKNSDDTAPNLWNPNTYYNLSKIEDQSYKYGRQLIVAGNTHGFFVAQPRATDATTATNQYTGESEVNKNMPPYLVVNIWQRIR